jgi:hypothetical protein
VHFIAQKAHQAHSSVQGGAGVSTATVIGSHAEINLSQWTEETNKLKLQRLT